MLLLQKATKSVDDESSVEVRLTAYSSGFNVASRIVSCRTVRLTIMIDGTLELTVGHGKESQDCMVQSGMKFQEA